MTSGKLNIEMKFDKFCNAVLERVFHGTPHDVVGSFDLQKIGSGEGAQAYGWGLYFAENPEVADAYKKSGYQGFQINGKTVHPTSTKGPLELAAAALFRFDNKNEAIEWIGNDFPTDGEEAKKIIKKAKTWGHSSGNLYTVDLDADPNDFIDWDEPIYESDKIYKLVNRLFEKKFKIKNYWQGTISSGSLFYNQISKTVSEMIDKLEEFGSIGTTSEQKIASEFLNEAGIKGIKYLDQGSREEGEGTYNYVVFDPNIIKIVAKNGEFVMMSKKPENVEI